MDRDGKAVAGLEWQKDEILAKLGKLGTDPDYLEEKKRLQKRLGGITAELFSDIFSQKEKSDGLFDKLYETIKFLLSIDCVFEASRLVIIVRSDNPKFHYLEDAEEVCIPMLLVKNLIEKGHEEQARLSIEFLCLESLEYEQDDRIIIF